MDLEKLQGEWLSGGAAITIDGTRFTTAQMGAAYSGRFEVNEAATPKTLALHFESGPETGNVNHGIYELTDAGWKICLNMTGGAAPREFGAAMDRGIALIRYARPKAAAALSGGEPVAELQGEWAMVSCVRAGDPLPAPLVKHGKRNVTGTATTLHFGPQLFMQGTLSQDGPGSFVLEASTGEGPQLGIYAFAGDLLKTCTGAPGKPRPSAYESTKAGGETYTEWKRR